VLIDTLLLWQLQLDLSVITVSESVHRTSVSTVIFVFIYDRTTDITSLQRHRRNRLTATSKQVSNISATVRDTCTSWLARWHYW